jgi:DNA-binding MarR family transcriptional regulator
MDSGQLSRVLRSEAEGLVVTEPSGADRRVRTARLTRAGLAERAEHRVERRAERGVAVPDQKPEPASMRHSPTIRR